jgi:hypothetical protein
MGFQLSTTLLSMSMQNFGLCWQLLLIYSRIFGIYITYNIAVGCTCQLFFLNKKPTVGYVFMMHFPHIIFIAKSKHETKIAPIAHYSFSIVLVKSTFGPIFGTFAKHELTTEGINPRLYAHIITMHRRPNTHMIAAPPMSQSHRQEVLRAEHESTLLF